LTMISMHDLYVYFSVDVKLKKGNWIV
jgi:hypothetical protein